MIWVEVVEVAVVPAAVAALAVAVVRGQAGWAAPVLLAPVATASVRAVDIECRTWQGSLAIRRSAPSAERR